MDWFHALPFLTRWMLVWSVGLSLCTFLGVLSPMSLVFLPQLIVKQFHVWRLFTPFLFGGGFSFPYAITLYMLISHSRLYEMSPYNTGGGATSADYLVMLVFGMVCMFVPMVYFGMPILFKGFMMYIVYVWSRKAEGVQSGFFMFRFPALYLPWILLAYDLVTGHSIMEDMIGIVVGHIYYFLIHDVPVHHGYRPIRTPRWVVEQLAWVAGVAPPPIHPSHRREQAQEQRPTHNWGRGRVLGSGSTSR